MSYLIGVVGLLGLAAVYVGLGLADRGREACGGCALRETDVACRACSSGSDADPEEAHLEAGPRAQGPESAPWETDGDAWIGETEPWETEGGWGR